VLVSAAVMPTFAQMALLFFHAPMLIHFSTQMTLANPCEATV
jgi:hypothetical protein